jgi:Gas vesicle protein
MGAQRAENPARPAVPVSQHRPLPPPAPAPASQRGTVREPAFPAERLALVDLLDRVLAGGVVVAGEVTLSIADVDMVTISLRALVTSVSALAEAGGDFGELNR